MEMDVIKIGSEYKYRLSSTCLKSGLLILPASMAGLFPVEGEVKARDSHSAKEYDIEIIDKRRVYGFKEFMEVNKLIVNDYILILLEDDGSYSLRVEKCTRQPKKSHRNININEVLDKLYVSERSYSEPEICQLFDISETDRLHKRLITDRRFIFQGGRWNIAKAKRELGSDQGYNVKVIKTNQPEERTQETLKTQKTPEAKEVQEVPEAQEIKKTSLSSDSINESLANKETNSFNDVKAFFRLMNYDLSVLGPDKMSIKINLGRRKYSVLLYFLEEGSSPDWVELAKQRRNLNLNYIAIFANHRDLIRLIAAAKSNGVSLWSWKSFYRLMDYSETVVVSPIDLEPHFASEGLFERGFEKFEANIHNIIKSRGRFSAVLERLASMKSSTVFFLDDIQLEDSSRDDILKVLDLLEHSPFQIVQKIAPAEFFLRQPVNMALESFAQYALSLKTRLPKSSRYRVQESNEDTSDWEFRRGN